jgi:hypothetical protein
VLWISIVDAPSCREGWGQAILRKKGIAVAIVVLLPAAQHEKGKCPPKTRLRRTFLPTQLEIIISWSRLLNENNVFSYLLKLIYPALNKLGIFLPAGNFTGIHHKLNLHACTSQECFSSCRVAKAVLWA